MMQLEQINLFLIVIILVLVYYLFMKNEKVEHMSNISNINMEAIQMVSSMYNNGILNVDNLKVNGSLDVVGNTNLH